MITDLLVPVSGTAGDDRALDAAIELARVFDAHVTVLEGVHLPAPIVSPWGLSPVTGFEDVYRELRDKAQQRAAQARARLDAKGARYEVRVAESFLQPGALAALHARHSDVCVVAGLRLTGDAMPHRRDVFNSVLMESGRPVLMIPVDTPLRAPAGRIAVAWKPRREATRALHDAMPLLMKADVVEVVVVNPDDGIDGEGELPGADIAAHLSRHGLTVQVTCVQRGARTAAAALLRHCMETGAQLLVCGGYGHSRLREWALGGVTRELLESADLPVLFSH